MNTTPFLIRALDRRLRQRERRQGWRFRMIAAWSGMRGSVSLAAALALPLDFPQRDLILFLTFAVIFTTLVLQGLTLPTLIRRLGGPRRRRGGARGAGGAALRGGRRRWASSSSSAPRTGRATTPSSGCARCTSTGAAGSPRERGDPDDGEGYEHRSRKYQKMVRQVLDAQREELVRLRNSGAISNEVMHRLERELDLEDERLEI